MTTIRAMVLAELARGPKTKDELLKAIDEIENTKQLSNCLHNLRNAGSAMRGDDGRYRIGCVDDSALVNNPAPKSNNKSRARLADLHDFEEFDRVSKHIANIGAGIAGPNEDVPTARLRRRSVLSRSASSYVAAQQAIKNLTQHEEAEQLSGATAQKRKTVRAILEKAAADNQSALDDYLASIADPRILGPLRNARDQARAALAALDNPGGPSC